MSWRDDDTTTTAPPPRRSMNAALLVAVIAGLLWAALNLLVVVLHLRDPAMADDVSVFLHGIGVVVLGSVGFVVVLIPTLLGLWATDDVSRLGAATFNAVVSALGGVVWLLGPVGSPDLSPGALAAVLASALVLFVPAGVVVWAWREWSQG